MYEMENKLPTPSATVSPATLLISLIKINFSFNDSLIYSFFFSLLKNVIGKWWKTRTKYDKKENNLINDDKFDQFNHFSIILLSSTLDGFFFLLLSISISIIILIFRIFIIFSFHFLDDIYIEVVLRFIIYFPHLFSFFTADHQLQRKMK